MSKYSRFRSFETRITDIEKLLDEVKESIKRNTKESKRREWFGLLFAACLIPSLTMVTAALFAATVIQPSDRYYWVIYLIGGLSVILFLFGLGFYFWTEYRSRKS